MNVYRVYPHYWDLYGNSTNENDYVFTHEELEMFAKDWEMTIDELIEQCEEEQFDYYCENCKHYTNEPTLETTTTGTDADGNRGWEVRSLACPKCGYDY